MEDNFNGSNGSPQYPLRPNMPQGNPQINEQLTPNAKHAMPWQPLPNHSHANQQPQAHGHTDHPYDLSKLNLQQQNLPHGPSISLSHEEADRLKREASRIIADERRQLDEAEQMLAMPGFLKAFEIFIKATKRK